MENKQVDASVEQDRQQTIVEHSIHEKLKVVIVINNQFTNTPNTTQLASGAGRSSAEGKAKNEGMEGTQYEPYENHKTCCEEEIIIILNNQINCAGENDSNSSATQVASGGGTNSEIENSNTKQQFSVGGSKDAIGLNKGMNSGQIEASSKGFNSKQQPSDGGPKLFIS